MASLQSLIATNKNEKKSPAFSVVMVHYSKLIPSEKNNYSTENIEELAHMIVLSGGIKQNLLARKKAPDEYELISGHRRRLAAKYLVEELGLEEFAMVPVHVEKDGDLISEVNLILTNCAARERSDWEKMMEVTRLTELMKAMQTGTEEEQERFRQLFGREPGLGGRELRKVVADTLGLSETKVANLNHINNRLSPELKERFQAGEIGVSAANEAAGLSPEEQKKLAEKEEIKLADVKKAVSESDTEMEEKKQEVQEQNKPDSSGKCLHRPDFACTLSDVAKKTPSDGTDCSHSCCWDCVNHGSCNIECYASANRPEPELPKEQQKPENAAEIAAEPLSAYGTPKKVYPEGSLIATEGCVGGHDCFSCAMECEIRGEDRYCRHAPLGNPFPCTQIPEINVLGNRIGARCQFVNHDLAEHCAGSGEASPCCMNCTNQCTYLCARAKRQLEEIKNDIEELDQENQEPDVIDAEFTEVIDSNVYTPQYFLREEQKKLNELLEAFKDTDPKDIPQKLFSHQKIIVAALAGMVCDLENEELKKQLEEEKPQQPELPKLRNNDQRAAFIDAYATWPIWIETKETAERYYRYKLPDVAMVVKVYFHKCFDYNAPASGRWEDRYHDAWGDQEYYLVLDGKHFRDCRVNRSALIDYLKEIQKKG